MDNTTNFSRYKSKDLLEIAYKNRNLYSKLLKSQQSQDLLNKLSRNSLAREIQEKEYLNNSTGSTGSLPGEPVQNASEKKESERRLNNLQKAIFFEEDIVKKIGGKKYILDKSTGDLYTINLKTAKRGKYVGKFMEDGTINTDLPQSLEKEIELNIDGTGLKQYIHQTETNNLYDKITRKYIGRYKNGMVDKNLPQVDLSNENYIFKNFVFLTKYEKKMLVYLIDYFFNYKYNSLRNVILNSLYDNKFKEVDKQQNKNINYVVSLDIEIDLCKLFIHIHLYTKYKKIIDACEAILLKEVKGTLPTKPEQANLIRLFEFLFEINEYNNIEQRVLRSELRKKPISEVKPILHAQILALKKKFCEKLAQNKTELKNSIKYIQRIVIILFLKNNLLKTNDAKVFSQVILQNEKYLYDIFRMQDFSIIKEKMDDITLLCNTQNAKYSFFNQFIKTYTDLDKDKIINNINCKVKKIKETMVSNVCKSIEDLGEPIKNNTGSSGGPPDPLSVGKFIDDMIGLATNVGTFAVQTIVDFIPKNQAIVEDVKRKCSSEVSSIQQTETIADDLTKIFKDDENLSEASNANYNLYINKYEKYLDKQNIVKKMELSSTSTNPIFNNNLPIKYVSDITYKSVVYTRSEIDKFNKMLLKLQTVSMKDLNDSFVEFNMYTIIDFTEDLIKYGLIPEFIDENNKDNNLIINTNICKSTNSDTEGKVITDCHNTYNFKDKYISNGIYKKNTFKLFILFLHDKLKTFNSKPDIEIILKNEYKNNICIQDEDYIKIADFYNIFKSLTIQNESGNIVPNKNFLTFQEIEESRLKIVGKYDIARFNYEFEKELKETILDKFPADKQDKIMSKILNGFDPFDFNVLMYYFYDVSKEEEFMTTFISFIIKEEGTQNVLVQKITDAGLKIQSVMPVSNDFINFTFDVDDENTIKIIEYLKLNYNNVKIFPKLEQNIILYLDDSNYQEKLDLIKTTFGSDLVSTTNIKTLQVKLLMNLTQTQINDLKANPYFSGKLDIKNLDKLFKVEFVLYANSSQKNNIKSAFPDAKFKELAGDKLQLLIKGENIETLRSGLLTSFPNLKFEIKEIHVPKKEIILYTDYDSALKIKETYGSNAKMNFNISIIIPATINDGGRVRDIQSNIQNLNDSIIDIVQFNTNQFGGKGINEKRYILQMNNINIGNRKLKDSSTKLNSIFNQLNYKVKYFDILMNRKKGNKKRTKRKKAKKLKGGAQAQTKKLMVTIAASGNDTPAKETLNILKKLKNNVGIDLSKIKLVPETSSIANAVKAEASKSSDIDLKNRFEKNNAFTSKEKAKVLLLESKVEELKQKATQDSETEIQKYVNDGLSKEEKALFEAVLHDKSETLKNIKTTEPKTMKF